MRCLLVASALLCALASGLQVQMPPKPPVMTAAPSGAGSWTDLFSPPYQGVPSVTMAISCIDDTHCYVPGGSNNEGFDMFVFDGHTNGAFTPLVMPDVSLMMMAVGMGGTKDDPKGVAGGIGIGNGLQYAKNSTTFEPSYVPELFVETQDIRTTANGMESIAIGQSHVLYSKDAGAKFAELKINSNFGKCASGRYGAMVTSDEWYVTLGSWPSNNDKTSNTKGRKELSERVSVVNGKRVSRKMSEKKYADADETHCGYAAVIAKTTDGGKTFTNVFSQTDANTTNFYFNGIDCANSTNCVAVGEGFNADPAAHVYLTTDGSSFTEVLKLTSTQSAGMFSLMSVRFRTATEVWVAGSVQSSFTSTAVFYVSMDGGKTWTDKSGTLSNIGDITDLSFTPGGDHGFATAVTIYDDSTVLRYGKADLPPAPPAPPTSGPTGTFIQSQCQNSACNEGCQNHTFNTGSCLPLNGGGSAMASCTATDLVQTIYPDSPSCTGTSQQSKEPLNSCLKDNQGTYFENYCNGGAAPPSSSAAPSGPTTTAVPVPPTPMPQSGSLIQMHCSDSGCTQGCQNGTFPLNQCLPVQGGGSAKVTCTSSTVNEEIYSNSDCSGSPQSGTEPVGQCLQAQQGGYLENICMAGQSQAESLKTYKQGSVFLRQKSIFKISRGL